eukprot:705964-Rhodomonas_salina.1
MAIDPAGDPTAINTKLRSFGQFESTFQSETFKQVETTPVLTRKSEGNLEICPPAANPGRTGLVPQKSSHHQDSAVGKQEKVSRRKEVPGSENDVSWHVRGNASGVQPSRSPPDHLRALHAELPDCRRSMRLRNRSKGVRKRALVPGAFSVEERGTATTDCTSET